MNFELRQLTANDEYAFFAGMKEWSEQDLGWYTFSWKPGMTFSEMLEILRTEHLGINIHPERVPHTMLYGFADGVIVGRVSVRHTLNERLARRGGHIGYAVAPKYRRQGFAKRMLPLALDFTRTHLGLPEVMLTCGDDNQASSGLIEKFGGVLKDKVWDDEDEEMIRRYWIREA